MLNVRYTMYISQANGATPHTHTGSHKMYSIFSRTENGKAVRIADDILTLSGAVGVLTAWHEIFKTDAGREIIDNYSAKPPAGWHRTLVVVGTDDLPRLSIWIEPTAN